MQYKEQQQLNTGELLDNIHYINQLNKEEIKQLNDQFRQRFSEPGAEGSSLDSLVDEVSNQLGQLAAKVNLTDQAIHSLRQEQKHESTVATEKNDIVQNWDDLHFGANQLVGNNNLLPIETNEKGIDYTWTGADPETKFNFGLDRSKKLGMEIRIISLIKQEYPNLLKVIIDGTHIKHSLGMDGELFVVSCNLPPSSNTGPTDIRLVLPATHRPKDLGDSGDGRQLGMAIHEIRFGKPAGRFGTLLERLKFRS